METLKNDLILCSVSRMYAFAVKRDLPSLFETEHPWTTPQNWVSQEGCVGEGELILHQTALSD